jgi:hypothetical protein
MELAGGLPWSDEPGDDDAHLFGAITLLVAGILGHGARLDPDDPPVPDAASQRPNFSRYPVRFPAAG